jgi:DNA-binding response OmpR family regulator
MNAESPKADSPRVLIADDDPTIVLLLEHVLEGLGRTFEVADNGAQAWSAWEKSRHPLVVLDIEMPEMDGLEVCRRIRAADEARLTFILIVTGRDRAADLEAVLAAGADDYVSKPTTGQRLLARLRIAQRRMAQDDARRLAEEEARKARWLAGIVEATVALQHEINNPLTSLLATAELMQIDAEEKGASTEDIDIVLEQARRISELVKRLEALRDPKTVPYGGTAKMIDLSKPR